MLKILLHSLPFDDLSAVGLVLHLVDCRLSFNAVTLLVRSSVTRKIVPEMTYNVSNGTLNRIMPIS